MVGQAQADPLQRLWAERGERERDNQSQCRLRVEEQQSTSGVQISFKHSTASESLKYLRGTGRSSVCWSRMLSFWTMQRTNPVHRSEDDRGCRITFGHSIVIRETVSWYAALSVN